MLVRTTTGSLTAVAQAVTVAVDDADEVSVSIQGTFVGTFLFEITLDGTNWNGFAMIPYEGTATTTGVISATAPGIWYSPTTNSTVSARVRCSVYVSGTANVVATTGRVARG